VASGANASAGGFGAIATGPGSTVYGNQANDNGVAGSAVLGQGAFVDAGVTGSNVVLGQDSSAVVGAQGGYTAFGLSASQTSIGEVSVGTAAGRRQITNVAAGSAPTDAVNVAQLTGVATAATTGLSTLGTSVASNLGGGSAFDPATGTLTAPTYGVQGATYSNLGSAIGGLDTAVSTIASGKGGPFVSDNSVVTTQALASGADSAAGGFGSSATGAASTVVGNQATDNGVANSSVLGQGATIMAGLTGSNVALGQGSTATLGAQSNYAAFGLSAPQSSAGEVSLGAAGAERKITNVAAGSGATDAVNVAQLQGSAALLGASVAAGLGGGAAYDPTTGLVSGPTYTVNGNTYTSLGTAIVGLDTVVSHISSGKSGPFVADNTVTSAQPLAAGANSVAGGFGASASGAASVVLGNQATDNGVSNSTALGQGAMIMAGLTGSNVALGQGSVVSVGAQTAYVAFGLAGTVNSAGEVSVGSAGGLRKLTNLAPGSELTDAVNVRQLQQVSTRLGEVGTDALMWDPKANSGVGAYTAAHGSIGGPSIITSVAPGVLSASSWDAVNGAQLFATNEAMAQLASAVNGYTGSLDPAINGQGARYERTNDNGMTPGNAYARGQGATAIGYNAQADGAGSLALGADTHVTVDGGIAIGQGSVSDRATVVRAGKRAVAPGAFSVGAPGMERQIINVADGTQAQDAVTVRQLQGAIASVAVTGTQYFHANSTRVDSLGVGTDAIAVGPETVVNGDAGIGMGLAAQVDSTAPNGIAIGSSARSAMDSAVALGSSALASGTQSLALGASASAAGDRAVAMGATASATGANAMALGSGAQALQAGDVALGAGAIADMGAAPAYTGKYSGVSNTIAGTVSLGAAGAERTVSNVADAQNATDAVNLRQLDGAVTQANLYTDQQIATINSGLTQGGSGMFQVDQTSPTPAPTATGTNATAGGAGAVASASNSTALGNAAESRGANSVALGAGSSDGGRENVVSVGAAGKERQVTNVAAGTAQTDAVNVQQLNAAKQGSVQYATKPGTNTVDYSRVTLGNGGAPVTLSNVAAGVENTDAVNVRQLNEGLGGAVQQSNAYTDGKFQNLRNDVDRYRRDASGGTATALAVAGLAQAYLPGRGMFSIAGSTYDGQQGFAMGLSTVSGNGKWVYKMSGSTNTRGTFGAVIGAGYQW
jgi:autotransporter adhesin